jgi:hypothetical protein
MKRINVYLQKLKTLEVLFDGIYQDITKYSKNRLTDLTVEDHSAIEKCVDEKLPEVKELLQKLKWRSYKLPEDTVVNVDDLLIDLDIKDKKIEELNKKIKQLEDEKSVEKYPNKDLQIEVLVLREDKINKARVASEVRTELIKQGFKKTGIMIKLIDRIIKA